MKKKKVILISILSVVVAVVLSISIAAIAIYASMEKQIKADPLPAVTADAISAPDKIHFLNTGSSDAILLESNGHFAMVDAGEDSDNPRGFSNLVFDGYEEMILKYLKQHASDEYGKVHLDFVLGTHAHSDHIGGFDTIILDPDVTIDRAYLKEYNSSLIQDRELIEWDNQEVYDQMVSALNTRNVPIIYDLNEEPFQLGNFTITLFNTKDPQTNKKIGENDRSLGVLIEKNGTKVFLAGDINNYSGDEKKIGPAIGKVDMLKVGHHGHNGSSSWGFVKNLSPKICVITNKHENLNRKILFRFETICHPKYLTPDKEEGILAVIGDNGNIKCYGKI